MTRTYAVQYIWATWAWGNGGRGWGWHQTLSAKRALLSLGEGSQSEMCSVSVTRYCASGTEVFKPSFHRNSCTYLGVNILKSAHPDPPGGLSTPT